MVKDKSYKREITHEQYTFKSEAAKEIGIVNKLNKEITHNKVISDRENVEYSYYLNLGQLDKFLKIITDQNTFPLFGAITFFIIIIIIVGVIKFPNDAKSISFIFWSLFSISGFIYFVFYYFKTPLKEKILNREESLITFPGFMWKNNITMSIHDVEFTYSQPSAQGIGAYQLRIVRPDKIFSGGIFGFGGTCYEDLSFILWYMDKNRPLPPGNIFDEFRKRDFERRKAAGFPKPLFPSRFDTPEATLEQQAERVRIGGW